MFNIHEVDYTAIFDLNLLLPLYQLRTVVGIALYLDRVLNRVRGGDERTKISKDNNQTDTNPFSKANSALMILLVAAPMQTLFARTTNLISNTLH